MDPIQITTIALAVINQMIQLLSVNAVTPEQIAALRIAASSIDEAIKKQVEAANQRAGKPADTPIPFPD